MIRGILFTVARTWTTPCTVICNFSPYIYGNISGTESLTSVTMSYLLNFTGQTYLEEREWGVRKISRTRLTRSLTINLVFLIGRREKQKFNFCRDCWESFTKE
jgi:hypothetical protein